MGVLKNTGQPQLGGARPRCSIVCIEFNKCVCVCVCVSVCECVFTNNNIYVDIHQEP